MLSARSRKPMEFSLAMETGPDGALSGPWKPRWRRRSERLRRLRLGGRRGPRLAALAALVPMALDLPREVLRAEVHRVRTVPGRLAGAQGDPLEVQRRLRHLGLRDRGVALVGDLDLQPRELGDLLGHLGEALLHALADLVGHG